MLATKEITMLRSLSKEYSALMGAMNPELGLPTPDQFMRAEVLLSEMKELISTHVGHEHVPKRNQDI